MNETSIVKFRQFRTPAMTACAVLSLGLFTASAQVSSPAPAQPAYGAPVYYGPDSGQDLGFYFEGELGPSFTPNFSSSRLGYGAEFSAQPGVRGSVEPGFNFLAAGPITLGAELDTGVIYNHLNYVSAAGEPTLHGDMYQVPVLGDLKLEIRTGTFIVPYIGVGGGGDYFATRLHEEPFFYGDDIHNDQFDPAVQALGGVKFRLGPNFDVGFGYKFLAAFPNEGRYIGTHSALATFTARF